MVDRALAVISRRRNRTSERNLSSFNKPGRGVPNQDANVHPSRPVSAPPPPSAVTPAAPVPAATSNPTVSKRLQKKLAKRAKQEAREEQRREADEGQPAKKWQLPPWLVSVTFHLALLLILALVQLSSKEKRPLLLQMGFEEPESVEYSLVGEAAAGVVQPEITPAFEQVPEVAEILKIDIDSEFTPELGSTEFASVSNIPISLAQGLSGRQGASKQALLNRYGGTAETESAVELGLKWLAKQQRMNGSWSMRGKYSDGASIENTTAATAMALNAFLGAGYTHKEGKYQQVVKKGLNYLVGRQDSEGFFAADEPDQQFMYAQAIATICVAEAYGMSKDSDLFGPAALAITWAEWAQSPQHGWRYQPRGGSDLSVTGWFLMALETGKMAGLQVDEEKLQNVSKFLDQRSHFEDSQYSYSDLEDDPRLTMTAEGLLCRIYLGWPSTHPALLRGIDEQLLRRTPALDEPNYSVYFWYYATQVLHHVGGRMWEEWNAAMSTVLPARQTIEGPEAGSWDPTDDIYGTSGRLYTTCLNIYCLEVYYRHLSIYDRKSR